MGATSPGKPTAAPTAPGRGERIGDRYQLEALIGEGGMARIWRATDLTLQREVAVKFLFLREGRDRRVMIERFLREARIAAAVRHPNVVGILDFGTEGGRPFMVMELLVGESLEERLVRSPALTLEELVAIASGVLDGLAAVHKEGIVHRDLKPDNIFLVATDDGPPIAKLLDFGVSRDTDPSSRRRSGPPTGDGFLVGTPEYMSPEQARGVKDVDWRTDLYGVGVVLYEALAGRLPYSAEAVGDLIIAIVSGGAPSVASLRPEVGEPLSGVIARALAADRGDRWQSAREMRDALLAAADASAGMGVRSSLPASVPARRLAATIEEASGDVEDTPDEIDATPRAWSLDASLASPPGPHRARWPWIAALCAVPIAGAALWFAREPRDVAPARPPRALSAPEPEPPPAPLAPVAPAFAQPEVTVTLRGLPPHTRVRVDGEDVDAEHGVIRMPRDGRARELSIHAPGRSPWRTSHLATDDGAYELPPPRRAPPEPPSEGVIRDLDY